MSAYYYDTAHVVYASDDKFAWILGVSMTSLFENSKDMEEIQVYILDGGIRKESREKLEEISRSYNRSLPVWIQAKNVSRELSMEVSLDRGSLCQYARLFVSSSLPADLTRVLYLDCDTIFLQSVHELWNLDLKGKTIGALMDAFSKYYRANIGLEPRNVMFNSGVMLIDLERWRQQSVEERLKRFICSKKGKIQQGDQGALNAVLSKDTYCFEPRFNAVTIYFDFTYEDMMTYRKPPTYYTKEEVNRAAEEPVIVHFTTSFLSKRPWMEGCVHRYVGEWIKYKETGPWKNKSLWKNEVSCCKRIPKYIYEKLPKPFSFRMASFLQAYVRPIKFKLINFLTL